MAETLDHGTLTQLVAAGKVRVAHVVGDGSAWCVWVRHGRSKRPLTAQRSGQVRRFARLETLVTYLRGIGIDSFDVDAASYDPESSAKVRRPDRAAALRQAHGAAAYDAWFRAQVQAAIDDPRPSVPSEVVEARFAAKREALRKRIGTA